MPFINKNVGKFKVEVVTPPVFKVWLQIEEIDEDHGTYENRGEPTSLGTFVSLEAAEAFFCGVEEAYVP